MGGWDGTYLQQVDVDPDLVQLAQTLEEYLLVVSVAENLPVVVLQHLELAGGGGHGPGGSITDEGRRIVLSLALNQHKQYLCKSGGEM